jgi:hypothetical protein
MIHNSHFAGSGRRRLGNGLGAALSLGSSALSAGIGAATSLAAAAIGDWMNSIQLSHDADTATTLIVNGLAQQLSNLDAAYLADPASCASQRAALDAYDQAWAWLQSPAACGNPSYGSAGNRCISDRAPGGIYPWQTYYRDPIANDPRLSSAGCDTGQEVILPSITTGTYAATDLTSAGGDAATGQTAAQLATAALTAAAAAPTTSPAIVTSSTIFAGVPNIAVYAGIGLLAFLFLRPSS